MNDNEYILITLSNRKIRSFEDFIDYEHVIYIDGWNIDKHFDTQRNYLYAQMSDSDKKVVEEENGSYPKSGSDLKKTNTLPHPCMIGCIVRWLTRETIINTTNAQVATDDVYAFENEKIQDIYSNDGFVPDTSVSKRAVNCSVIGWFKSDRNTYSIEGGVRKNERVMNGRFRDISGFVTSMNTSVSKQGGSVSISLPYIINDKKMKSTSVTSEEGDYTAGNVELDIARDSYYKSGVVGRYGRVKPDFFSSLIQNNDLLFISFEKLEMEESRVEGRFDIVDGKYVEAGVFDMIALVDDVRVTRNASGQASVEVSGRDLMKLIVDDGTWFFNSSCCQDPQSVFWNIGEYRKQGDVNSLNDWMNGNQSIYRMRRIAGEVDVFSNPQYMTIEFVLKTVLSQLSNIEVVPQSLFDAWGDDRTKFYDWYYEEKSKK